MDFQAVVRPHRFMATGEKNVNFPPMPTIKFHSQDVPPPSIQEFSRWTLPTISLLQSQCVETDVWMWFTFHCECGAFPPVTPLGEIPAEKNDLQKNDFKQCVTLRKQNAGKTMFLQGKKGISRE